MPEITGHPIGASVPPGIFVPTKEQGGIPKRAPTSFAPLDWLIRHPMTRRWYAKASRSGLGAAEAVDTAILLADGNEGIIWWMAITGHALVQGDNQGISWRIFVDRVPTPIETSWSIAIGVASATISSDGSFDYLAAGDGLGQSWGEIKVPLYENAVVEVGMRNNGGGSDPMGWTMFGFYWPINLREEWVARGWRK